MIQRIQFRKSTRLTALSTAVDLYSNDKKIAIKIDQPVIFFKSIVDEEDSV